ncbi:MAG: hypothetical protein EA402_09475 [Planctomycetota bacterium]|nr:MAG: hypothetical protein EA402_09475 [Planctomycetota bacterium]
MACFQRKNTPFWAFLLADLEIGAQWREAKSSPGAPGDKLCAALLGHGAGGIRARVFWQFSSYAEALLR